MSTCCYHQVVGDNAGRIAEVLRLACSRADAVLVTGGLGPTEDDITRDVLADLLGSPMVRVPEIETYLRDRFAGFGSGDMPVNNLRQADVPEGARFIMPERGTAPGLIAEVEGATVYAMPGVPAEMVEMMESTILPELASRVGTAVVRSHTLRCTGIGESRVAEILHDLFEASANPSLAYLASAGEVKVRLTAKADTVDAAEALIEPLAAQVRARLGDVVFTEADEGLEQTVMRLLRETGRTIACAESLTGGSVAARLTRAAGASASFVGSAVVYTAEAKQRVLGVSRETIDGPGVVSEACAREMAAGARRALRQRRRGLAHRRGGARAARRRRTRAPCGSPSTRPMSGTHAATAPPAIAIASADGPSRRCSIWPAATSTAASSPRPID